MSDLALRTRGLTKRYKGHVALDGLDLDVPRGTICGLIGPNGAGKTTAFGVVAGFIRPDRGEVDLLGQGPFHPARHAGRIGILPQDCEISRDTSVNELLVYWARLGGLSEARARASAERSLDAVGLGDRASARVPQLSHGMRRRLQVAQALLGEPELILLDEPMSGLDPELVVAMRELFLERRGDSTLLISSHNLQELEAICDYVIFISDGRCTRQGPLAEVTGSGVSMSYRLEMRCELGPLQSALPDFSFSWRDSTLVVEATSGLSPAKINALLLPRLLEADARLIEVHPGVTLEAAYLASRTR